MQKTLDLRGKSKEEVKRIRRELVEELRDHLIFLAGKAKYVVVDDARKRLHKKYGEVLGIDYRFLGGVMRCKELQKDGYESTVVKTSHKRPVFRFKLA